jgi:hypothetical protein
MIAPVMSRDIKLSTCTSMLTLDQTPICSEHKTEESPLTTTAPDKFFKASGMPRSSSTDNNLEREIYDGEDDSIIYIITKPKP